MRGSGLAGQRRDSDFFKAVSVTLRVHVIIQIVYTLDPKYLNREYFKANVYTI